MRSETAILIQHPRAPKPVLSAYGPVTAQSVIAAISACNADRQRITEATGVYLPLQTVPEWCLSSVKPDDPRRI